MVQGEKTKITSNLSNLNTALLAYRTPSACKFHARIHVQSADW